jgi:hypothetical protein
VLQLVNATSPDLEFRKIASQFRGRAEFGLLDGRTFSNHPFTNASYPSLVFYRARGGDSVALSGFAELEAMVEKFAHPAMAVLNRRGFKRACGPRCFARVGQAPKAVLSKLEESPLATFYVAVDSQGVEELRLREGDWIAIDPRNWSFARLAVKADREFETLSGLASGKLEGLVSERLVDSIFCPVGFLQSLRLKRKAKIVWRLLRKADILVLDVLGGLGYLIYRLRRKSQSAPIHVGIGPPPGTVTDQPAPAADSPAPATTTTEPVKEKND